MKIFAQHESEIRGYCRANPAVFDRAKNADMFDEHGTRHIDFFADAGGGSMADTTTPRGNKRSSTISSATASLKPTHACPLAALNALVMDANSVHTGSKCSSMRSKCGLLSVCAP